jgi:hypothetical protein
MGISFREFARRAGCSDSTVRYNVYELTGALHRAVFADGSLDPDFVEAFAAHVHVNRLALGKRW